ncbi:aminodeoxychorismate lyase [Methylophaga sp. OBS3]|uniref:aminodeoxychorismate lyase n=1 Tax=Methylophaga sp. OBS3 TaxID=2991934 RepID=UPI00224D4E00|nr:aminodeoxychorismate lyase [Methylophaga sp. OBS3]MCX4189257.1 aminodeoxychorismate lyase [Methylophaga sp. OBS3]
MILINGQPEDRIAVGDRGLQYGDGLFETIAYRNQTLEWVDAHLQRLERGCQRLNLPLQDVDLTQIQADLKQVTADLTDNAVIKVIITRGVGGRGYQYAENVEVTRIVSSHPFPIYPESHQSGVTVRLCEQRLAINPQLAGIKHLNRLEQVLARNEWRDPTIAEGLMLNTAGELIEGTMSNILLVQKGQLFTPDLSECGIRGTMRQNIINVALSHGISVKECKLSLDDLLHADEVFLCNSVIGIWPVTKIIGIDKTWIHGLVTQKLQHWLSQAIMHP